MATSDEDEYRDVGLGLIKNPIQLEEVVSSEEVDAKADKEIARLLQLEASAPGLSVSSMYFHPLWYTRGGDAWTNEDWWVDLAEARVRRQSKHYRPSAQAFHILLANGREEFRAAARDFLIDWEGQGAFDAEHFLGLLEHFYTELPIAKRLLDGRPEYAEPPIQKLYRDPKQLSEEIQEAFEYGDLFSVVRWVRQLGPTLARSVITNAFAHALHAHTLAEAQEPLEKLRETHQDIAILAGLLEWPDVAEALRDNPHYMSAALGPFLFNSPEEDLLALSLLPAGSFITRLASHVLTRQQTNLRALHAAAVAWKRIRARESDQAS